MTNGIIRIDISRIDTNDGQLEGLPRNPRLILDEKFEALKRNIRDYPDLLQYRGLLVYPAADGRYIAIGGNMRLRALRELGAKDVPCAVLPADTPVETLRAYTILDNNAFGQWDWDIVVAEWNKREVERWGVDLPDDFADTSPSAHILDTPFDPPFTRVINSREGEWQERKRAWRSAIKGSVRGASREKAKSRTDTIWHVFNDEHTVYRSEGGAKKYGSFDAYLHSIYTQAEIDDRLAKSALSDVSLFDPVLAEVLARRYTPHAHSAIIDPFAGDTLKGYVFGRLGHSLTGIELRHDQVELNRQVIAGTGYDVTYIEDDGQNIGRHVAEESADLVFSCPPYFDLEHYSDDPRDASNQKSYEAFIGIIRNALAAAARCLRHDRYAVIVVGDVRDKWGFYRRLHDDTRRALTDAGMTLRTEIVYEEVVAGRALVAATHMRGRKVSKVHQNVLVFFKQ